MSSKPSKNNNTNFLKYSGLASQMLGTIGAGVYGGIQLDKYYSTEKPLFTIFLSLLSIIIALYFAVRGSLKK